MLDSATWTRGDHSVIERLARGIDADPVLAALDRGFLRHGIAKVIPAGPDRVACAVARAVAQQPESAAAVALPRGAGPLPVLLGICLALWRKRPAHGYGRLVGSVAVCTRRAELREFARKLRWEGDDLDGVIPVGRLVGLPVADQRRIKAAALSLDRSVRDGLDQQDSWLLFQLPNIAPPLAHNVIGATVVDCAASSVGSWERTFERNVAARRRQVWVGELGDGDFERFCAQRDIPLMRLDWGLLEAAARAWGEGSSALASDGLASRALDLPPLGACTVSDAEVEHWLKYLQQVLHEMRHSARFAEEPEVVGIARWTGALLARSAYPLRHYERAAARLAYSTTCGWLADRVNHATATPFRGKWKQPFYTYWEGVKAAVAQLRKLLDSDDHPKWWALCARLMDAVEAGERVRVLCQTRAERYGLIEALYGDDCPLDADDLDRLVEVRAFSDRAEAAGETTTLLCGPPPERFASIYLAGDAGRVEVLCYPHEVPRLRRRAESAWRDYTDPDANHSALDRLGLGTRPADSAVMYLPARDELVRELPTFQGRERFEADEPPLVELADPEDEFWATVAELGSKEPDEAADEQAAEDERRGGAGEAIRAVLVRFVDAPPMYLRADTEVTVVDAGDDGQPAAHGVPAAELPVGARVAVLPGSERGDLLSELMAAWDERLALARMRYLPMYERALDAAIERLGMDGVARRVGLTDGAIYAWVRGKAWPGKALHLAMLLEASGDEQAIKHREAIHLFFSKTRGAHRFIGRVLNDAVGETVVAGGVGGENLRKLTELVGGDEAAAEHIAALFDNVHVLRVADVEDPRDDIPAGVCGSFLDADDPYLKAKGVL